MSVLIDEDDDAPLLAAWRRGEVKLSLVPPEKQADDKPKGDTLDKQEAEEKQAA